MAGVQRFYLEVCVLETVGGPIPPEAGSRNLLMATWVNYCWTKYRAETCKRDSFGEVVVCEESIDCTLLWPVRVLLIWRNLL